MRRASTAFGFALALALALAADPSAAADRTIPYADLHGMFERVERLKGGKYVKAAARLSSADPSVPTTAIKLVIRSRQGDTHVAIAADGTAEFPLRQDLLAENPPVVTNVAEGKMQLTVALTVEAEPVERFRYGLLGEMLGEAKSIVARQGMLARMLLPDFEDLVVSFPAGAGASATIELAEGPLRLAADAEGNIVIRDRRDWRRQDPFIQLSQPPLRIALRAS